MLNEDLVKFFASNVKSGSYGDIRLNEREGTLLVIENGKTRRVSQMNDSGFGLRVMKNGIWGFASSTELSQKAIKKALDSAYSYAKSKANSKIRFEIDPEISNAEAKVPWKRDLRDIELSKKLALVKEADAAAKGKETMSTMSAYDEIISHWVQGSSLGNITSFYESYPRLIVSSFVKDSIGIQAARKTLGGNCGFEMFEHDSANELGKEVLEESHNLIGAKAVKGGKYDVVLDPSMTGVYTHEAFGHATESDAVLAGESVLEGRLGRRVGNDTVTIIDDPTMPGERGSFQFDQEGTRAKRRTLVENGVLKSYLTTLETSNRLGLEPNGAGRSMDYSCRPIARMSNTFIKPGDFKDDIYEDIKEGVAFYGFQYGYVDPGSGKFMFKSQYGRMIRKGKQAEFIRDAALTGSTLEILSRIDAIGKNFALDGGFCGKEGQWVPVTSGGPNIRVRQVVVGGQ